MEKNIELNPLLPKGNEDLQTKDNEDLLPKDIENSLSKSIDNLLSKDIEKSLSKNLEELLPKDKIDCFIFLGETGTGKTSIINLLCGSKNIIGDGVTPETKKIKYEKGEYSNTDNKKPKKYYYCLDSPGFNDPEKSNQQIDISIRDYLSVNENMKIKGVFFVINFQHNKLTSSFWDSFNTILNIFPMENLCEHIVICFTHTYPEKFINLEDQKEKREFEIKSELKKKMDEIYKEKEIDMNKIKCLFIDLCSGEKYEKLDDGPKKEADKENNQEKDKLQKIITEFKDKDPMHFSKEEKEEKDQLFFEEKDEKYVIYEVDFKKIIYRDFKGQEIHTKCWPITRQKELYTYTNNFVNNHKRGISLTVGGICCLPFLVGLCLPGVNAVEASLLVPFIIGAANEGVTGYFISKKGWKSTIEKIKNGEIRKLEDLKNNKIK